VDRRVGAWLVAAVVTVALVAGGVLVARGGDRSPAVLPALDLAATGQAAAGQGGAGAAAEPARTADSARAAIEPAPAPGGTAPGRAGGASPRWPPVTYKLGAPLPDLPDRARAWKLGNTPDAGRLAALAAALGLDGRPLAEAGGWTLRDGRRGLMAHRLAGVPWTYEANLLGPCLRPAAPRRPGGVVPCLDPDRPVSSPPVPGVAPAKPPLPRPSRPVAPARPLPRPALPSRAEAERVARDLAARAGVDLDGARVRVRDDYATRTVTIDPAVGGQPTAGFAWTVAVGAGGTIRHATGYLATPQPADTYPLIGVEAGYEQLKRLPPLGPLRWAETPAVEVDPCPAGSRLPCAAKPLAPRVATVTGVRLGLQRVPALAKGERPAELAYLLPAYLFDLEGGWTDTRPVLAVPDRYLTR
jgi:hypothetical protein